MKKIINCSRCGRFRGQTHNCLPVIVHSGKDVLFEINPRVSSKSALGVSFEPNNRVVAVGLVLWSIFAFIIALYPTIL